MACLVTRASLPPSSCAFRLPETFKTDIEKACKSIFPLQNVSVRKVKMLKSPKFDRT
jgi:ribosomal protein S3AE